MIHACAPQYSVRRSLEARAHPNVVIVALANKLARTAWVVLQRGAEYDGRLLANA
jgi:hypothetical protein